MSQPLPAAEAAEASIAGPVDFQKLVFPYRRCADQDTAQPVRHPVVVVGAGPVGLSLAIDLAQQGVAVVLLDNDDRLSTGSRAICFAKRTLEIFDRLGCGDVMVDKGVSWNVGKVYFRDDLIFAFDLLPEQGHERPAFINLQQYYVEGHLAQRAAELPLIDLRWKNDVTGATLHETHVRLQIETPDGRYELDADHVVACDGSRSALRRLLGLESHGRSFKDRFLIADVKMKAGFPAERWFWFDPPFHRNQSVLLHRQPDDVWRIDFQLGWDADPDEAKKPENIVPRVRALLGDEVQFELEWASVYTFSCLRMDAFCQGRVLFAGDSAHGVSPFGARGANSGVQDVDNLAWKLAHVLRGKASPRLLASYGCEREFAADENIQASTRATDFITPKSEISRLFRDATLDLARNHPFARTLVNSGRLSVPATLSESPLNTPDIDTFSGRMVPGAVAADGPLDVADSDPQAPWLLRRLPRNGKFCALLFDGGDLTAIRRDMLAGAEGLTELDIVVVPEQGALAQRYDARPGTVYLLRPDHHVCARWRQPQARQVAAALRRALALEGVQA